MVSVIKISQFPSGGDVTTGDTTTGLLGGLNTNFNNPWTFLPSGTTGDRPVPAASMYYRQRLNTTLQVYEYYDPISVTWVELSGSGTGTVNPGLVNDLAFYAATGSAVSPITTANNALLKTSAGGVPSWSTTIPSGITIPGATITGSTAALTSGSVVAAPSAGTDLVNKTYADSLVTGLVTSIIGTTNRVSVSPTTGATVVDIDANYVGQSSITTLGTVTTGTWNATTVAINHGGTGVTSVTTAATASAWAGWDASKNLSANNYIAGYTTTVTSASPVTLTVASTYQQFWTGSTAQTVLLPVTSTLASVASNLAQSFLFVNNSTQTVTVQSSGGNNITVMAASTVAVFTCISNSGTTAASWNSDYEVAGLTVPISLPNGGTNAALTASNGGIFYSTATAGAILAGTATAGQHLQSGASGAPSWTTSTYPSTNAINTLLYASSANVLAALATANNGVLVTDSGGVPSISSTLPTAVLNNISGRLKSFQIFTSGSSATYTRPSGVSSILVEVIGGGGGGGGVTATAGSVSSAGGGGAGGYARLYIPSAASTYTYTVGTGGAGGLAGTNNGTAGNTTTFGASLQATGGSGGTGTAGSTTFLYVLGGVGGTGSNGDINTGGQAGGVGTVLNVNAGCSGAGAQTIYGNGGNSLIAAATGQGAGNYGAGGGGALTGSATNRAGGGGANGLIVVWEFS